MDLESQHIQSADLMLSEGTKPCMVVHFLINWTDDFLMLPRPQHGLESRLSLAANPTRITLNTINHALVAPPRSGRRSIAQSTLHNHHRLILRAFCLLSCLQLLLPVGKYLTRLDFPSLTPSKNTISNHTNEEFSAQISAFDLSHFAWRLTNAWFGLKHHLVTFACLNVLFCAL